MWIDYLIIAVTIYLPVIIGILSQLVFLALPINLKNWSDDDLNALTYIAIQLLVGAIVFVGIPLLFDLYFVGMRGAITILFFIFFSAWFRVMKMIPLEFSNPVNKTFEEVALVVQFNEFLYTDRLRMLEETWSLDEEAPDRYRQIKERLTLRKPEKAEKAGGT